MSFANSSSILLGRFQEKCHESISCEKKPAKVVFLYLRGYRHNFSSRRRTTIVEIEKQRIIEMNESYEKLFMLKQSRLRDTEWRRTAKFSEFCFRNAPSCNKIKKSIAVLKCFPIRKQQDSHIKIFVSVDYQMDRKQQ